MLIEVGNFGVEFEVTEFCPHCEREITLTWDVKEDGYQIYCPNCGKVMMLCSMCDGTDGGVCDWTENGCKYSDKRYTKTNNDGWIPVEEALPEQSGEYLTTSALGACAVLNFSAKYGLFNAFDDSDKKSAEKYAIRKVVAWQPLPKPYKPGRSET